MSPRPHILVINPNTTASVTALLQRHTAAAVGEGAQVRCATAAWGAPYIACEASYAVAAHATLDTWANALAQGAQPQAVLIGCFGDPGLRALQESAGVPVTGLAQAAFDAAAAFGKFAVVTGGPRWAPILTRLAHELGHGDHLCGVQTVAASGAQLASDPQWALEVLAQACEQAASRFAPQAIIIGGAGLAGMAALLQARCPLPLIDSVVAGAQRAWALAQPSSSAAQPSPAMGFDVAWQGLSGAMHGLVKPIQA